jgi:tetratricopeptide (TPR) repeat protein
MAYELITGQAVFAGRTAQRMLAAHMGEQPKPVTEFRGDLPAPLVELVMSCLAKEPDQRPQSAAEMARVLESITSGGGMQAMSPVLLGGPGMFKKALAIYAVAFVAVAILARAAIVGIGLPDWVFPGSLIVMALGLPVVLWTGYVQRVARRSVTATPTFTPGGTPATTHGTMATLALKAAPHVSWYHTARGGMYALGTFILVIGAFMAMRAFGIGPAGSLLATGALRQREPLLLTDFRTTNVDSTLGRVVSDAVRAGLSGSSAFALVSPARIVAALERMQQPRMARVDSSIARQIALREGIKAIVDGDVTGVPGGYIVSIRLVRADSGTEMASFRETGDGPRGLIDAADKLARALRSRAGESLRSVNATPPLFQATTSSLDALRKYTEGARANVLGDPRSVQFGREAVALDSTFASAWSSLAALLSNYGGSQSAIDSALTHAYRYRDKVSANERALIVARYYGLGPGRDRAKAIEAYTAIVQADSGSGALVNLGEQLRSRREYARAESLNLTAARMYPGNGTALGNAIEMQLNQGNVKEAAATAAQLSKVSAGYGVARRLTVLWAQDDQAGIHAITDSLAAAKSTSMGSARFAENGVKIRAGRLRDAGYGGTLYSGKDAASLTDAFWNAALEVVIKGPSPALNARLDSALARIPFRDMAMVDRPDIGVASVLAFSGRPDKARAAIARYRAEVTDTSIRRDQEAGLHGALGEIALAEGKARDAMDEFRRSDIGYDGAPADECAGCVSFDLARAYDAAAVPDSAILLFERYLSTPYWQSYRPELDPFRVPYIRERLGQLYEAKGNMVKAAENYRAFIDLWKNADAELQPRVAAVREKLRRMSLDAPKR